MIPVEYLGVSQLGPEGRYCAVLLWPEQQRVLPIWISDDSARQLQLRVGWEDCRRPDATLIFADVLRRSEDEVEALNIANQYRGVFFGVLALSNGDCYDIRPSDLLNLHFYFDAPLQVEESILTECSVYMTEEEIERTFDFTADIDDETWDTGKPWQERPRAVNGVEEQNHTESADSAADFEKFMRELGVSDEDLRGDDHEQ